MFERVTLKHKDLTVPNADETVRIAGRMSDRYSRDSRLRALATKITAGLRRVDVSGPERIARWVRKNIEYRQETPGVEVLQGPYTTLKYRVGDCDDLVILWAVLCRSIGIDARFAGVKKNGAKDYLHAIGYVPDHCAFYELTDDRTYGGKKHPIVQPRLAKGIEAMMHNPHSDALEPAAGGGGGLHHDVVKMAETPGFLLAAAAIIMGFLAWGAG